ASRRRVAEQADRRRARDPRENDQISSRPHHAEDGGGVARRAGPHGFAARDLEQGLSTTCPKGHCPKGQLEAPHAYRYSPGHGQQLAEGTRCAAKRQSLTSLSSASWTTTFRGGRGPAGS